MIAQTSDTLWQQQKFFQLLYKCESKNLRSCNCFAAILFILQLIRITFKKLGQQGCIIQYVYRKKLQTQLSMK